MKVLQEVSILIGQTNFKRRPDNPDRINSNAHGLGDNHGRNTDVALGLFPVGALFFNHSCNPNAAFVGLNKGRLVFRTIRQVQPEEEIAVSYIDLYASRDERRQVKDTEFENE